MPGPGGETIYLHEALRDALLAVAGTKGGAIDNRRLGWWLQRNKGRIVDGLRHSVAPERDRHSKTAKWLIERGQNGAGSAGPCGVSLTP